MGLVIQVSFWGWNKRFNFGFMLPKNQKLWPSMRQSSTIEIDRMFGSDLGSEFLDSKYVHHEFIFWNLTGTLQRFG